MGTMLGAALNLAQVVVMVASMVMRSPMWIWPRNSNIIARHAAPIKAVVVATMIGVVVAVPVPIKVAVIIVVVAVIVLLVILFIFVIEFLIVLVLFRASQVAVLVAVAGLLVAGRHLTGSRSRVATATGRGIRRH